jgi:hypothetical protein
MPGMHAPGNSPPTSWVRLILAATIASLALGATVVVLQASFAPARSQTRRSFQRLVGGLGLGASLDAARCWFSFDPRIQGVCGNDVWPIPSGRFYCPEHAFSVFSYPAMPSACRADAMPIPDAPTH